MIEEISRYDFNNGVELSQWEIVTEVEKMKERLKSVKFEESFFTTFRTGNTVIMATKYKNSDYSDIHVCKGYINISLKKIAD